MSSYNQDSSQCAAAASEAEEQLMAMLKSEAACLPQQQLCLHEMSSPPQPNMSELRPKIVEWSYRVVDQFGYDREVVYVTLNLLDRYVSLSLERTGSQDVQPRMYYLAAMTALFLSAKLSTGDFRRGCPRLRTFAELSRNQFTEQDLQEMELKMLTSLQWRVHPPTPAAFVGHLLRLFPPAPPEAGRDYMDVVAANDRTNARARRIRRRDFAVHVLHELSRYLTELAVCAMDVLGAPSPSTMAFAAILIGLDFLNDSALSYATRQDFLAGVSGVSSELSLENGEIIRLKERMRAMFMPEQILNGGNHILLTAWKAGMLDAKTVGLRKGKVNRTGSPCGGHPEEGPSIDRQNSINCVIEEAAKSLLN